jgi:futalosine hydrolase
MKILVVSATQMEIEPFLQKNNNCQTLIAGVAIPNTIYHLTKRLLHEKFDIVIQAGIAGTFTKKIKKGEVVIVEEDVFADIGVEEKGEFKTMFELGFDDKNKFPFTNSRLINNSQVIKLSSLKKVKAVTVNKITDKQKQIKYLTQKFSAEIESMEGAAFHYVCLQQNIPFLQLRSISNKVGERDKSKWRIKESIKNLNNELIKLVDSLK